MQEDTKELKVVEGNINTSFTKAESLEITSDESLKLATDELSGIKTYAKALKVEKEKLTKPAREIVKWAQERFRPLEDSLKNAEIYIKTKMLAYNKKKDEAAQKKEEAIAGRVERGTMKFETGVRKMDEVEKAETTTRGDVGKVTTRKVKKVEITNPELLPREYLIPDTVRIRKDALADVEIAGVRVYEEDQISAS